jgi:hypothetical protein
MHRTILMACVPCVLALAGALAALALLCRCSGAKLNFGRLRGVHRCEEGAVQSLSFVLTLPLFVMLVLFVIQVSQLMIGLMVVHYAAFAAARAAAVWLPADLGPVDVPPQFCAEPENVINAFVSPDGVGLQVLPMAGANSIKYQKIQLAAVLACAPICPSRTLGGTGQLPPWLLEAQQVLTRLYPLLAPTSQNNSRIPVRLANKLHYSSQNTFVVLEWMEALHPQRDADVGPSYNPRNHPDPRVPPWNPSEVGWEDPITVWVQHNFALLPGPGRFLARQLTQPDGSVDRVSQLIQTNQGQYNQTVYTTSLVASSTLVNEGLKSVHRYVQQNP